MQHTNTKKRILGLILRKTPLEYTITKRLPGTGNELTMVIDRFKTAFTVVRVKRFEIDKSTMVRDIDQAKNVFRTWSKELERKPRLC